MKDLSILARSPAIESTTDEIPSRELYQRLETLLVSGGDSRLAISRPEQRNSYGCKPFPCPELFDFASSTASVISERAYGRACRARAQLLSGGALSGMRDAFEHQIDILRDALLEVLTLQNTEIVFSPSGTDAQLEALFVVKSLLGGALATIVVGSDQTGSGTAYTALGHHFSASTANRKGDPIRGLSASVRKIEVPFCDTEGKLRSGAAMDAAVRQAVASAIEDGANVLLQIMDSSKLGWRAPSFECAAAIAARWPDRVRIVVDACQMRLSTARLRAYLNHNFLVLITGSKFFTGPPFSGALLIPSRIADAVDSIREVPQGLHGYSNTFDWPHRWPALREAFSCAPNYGQWLRWVSALEEIETYASVPVPFRERILRTFAERVPKMAAASEHLALLVERGGHDNDDGEMRYPSIISCIPHRQGEPLTAEQCRDVHRAASRDVSGVARRNFCRGESDLLTSLCQVGQPVALRHREGMVLRLCASARLVSRCWARGADSVEEAFAPEFAYLTKTIEKLDWLIGHARILESETT